ncbi:MAG TPA: hypothetical protein VK992_02050, partial [Candidatus Caenarcaniphilales bacterium]|nr:hypothetical protein [Candidatus Caenarcaniphilales bacterium]
DAAAGVLTFARFLGGRLSLVIMISLQAVIHVVAWVTLVATPGRSGVGSLLLLIGASSLVVLGLGLSTSSDERLRERGWQAQAMSLGLLALGWLAAATTAEFTGGEG